MNTKLMQFPTTNPNPVLSVAKDGTVIYSNEAGEPLLHEWDVRVGEKLPSYIGDFVQKVISLNSPEKMEVKAGKKVYLIVFHPLFKEKYLSISGFDISDQKELKDKLRESEAQETANVKLAEIIDIQAIQSLMNDFYKLTHIPIGLNDLKGNVLAGVGWQDICTKFHRVHPEACKHCIESDTKLTAGILPGEIKLYRCKNNMWDIATPIIAGNQHVGYIFSGQFFFDDEPLNYELFRSQARKYGFNEEEYVAALKKVPRLSREAVDAGMSFLMTFANMLSQQSYSNNKLAQSLAERDALVDALQKSEKRERARSDELAVVLDAVPAAVWITHDPKALQMTGNRLSYEWLRLPGGVNVSKAAPAGERPETYRTFKDGIEIPLADMPLRMSASGKEVQDYEFDLVYPDGTIRHLLGNARPLRDEQGNPHGSVSAFIDITERKKAEEALKKAHDNLEKLVEERTMQLEKAYNSLKESEKRLSEAQRMAHIGNWDNDLVIGELHWSDEMYRIFGRNPQESITYDKFLSYLHPGDKYYVYNSTKEAFNGNIHATNYRIVRPDGEERIVHSEREVIFDERNNPVRMKGTVQDITEYKKAEEELKESEKRYRIVAEQTGQLIYDLEIKEDKTNWVGAIEEITGYAPQEFKDMRFTSWLKNIHPDDLKPTLVRIDGFRKKGGKFKHEFRFRRKDGRYIYLEERGICLADQKGKHHQIVGVMTDITAKKEAEEALGRIEIARKKEIHHRIKNNLQVISSLLDLQAEKFKGKKNLKDSEILNAFRESQNRVISMALIHEELYRGGEIDTLNFSSYLEELAENLLLTYVLEMPTSD